MTDILEPRLIYRPFEYPEAFEFWQKQEKAHWLPDDVPMTKDISDWEFELSPGERAVIGNVLNSFVQSEIHVEEYWSQCVAKWFPKPEIQMMAAAFANMESIHITAYAQLNDAVGLDDYAAFTRDPTAVAKLSRLKEIKGDSIAEKAMSLAIFSGCTEGVNLFSSFAILMNLSRFNLLDGLENIVSWSARDESLHSSGGCYLFNELVQENPEVLTESFIADINEAFLLSVTLEDDFIDQSFALGKVRGIEPEWIKSFIRARANGKLQDMNFAPIFHNINPEHLKKMSWFDEIDNQWTDFFYKKVVDYFKCGYTVDNLFKDFDFEAIT